MVDEVVRQFGRIDVLHANAAVQMTRPACEVSEEEWDRMHNVNLKGVFLCCKYVIPVMQQRKKGAIVITSSGHAFATYANCSAYAATKGGELSFHSGGGSGLCAGRGASELRRSWGHRYTARAKLYAGVQKSSGNTQKFWGAFLWVG